MLQTIANIIILISAVIIAGKNIYGFFKKPVENVANATNKAVDKRIAKVLKKELKKYDKKRDTSIIDIIIETVDGVKEDTVQAVKKETEASLNSFKEEIETKYTEVKEEISQYTQMNEQIFKNMEQLNENMRFLRESQLEMLGQQIITIYEENKDKKKLSTTQYNQMKAFAGFYKKMGGNGKIEKMIKEMQNWYKEEAET